ncbi:MAG: HAMP domain-containing sensor histidine kinase [Actinomycetota bacterium]|nr:HAMP domain-containing sensor histidine kinase [Actinomycetota bacterium]
MTVARLFQGASPGAINPASPATGSNPPRVSRFRASSVSSVRSWLLPAAGAGFPTVAVWTFVIRFGTSLNAPHAQRALGIASQLTGAFIIGLASAGALGCFMLWDAEGEPPFWLLVGIGCLVMGGIQAWLLVATPLLVRYGVGGSWPSFPILPVAGLAIGLFFLVWPSVWAIRRRTARSKMWRWTPFGLTAGAVVFGGAIARAVGIGQVSLSVVGSVTAIACGVAAIGYAIAWVVQPSKFYCYLSLAFVGLAQAGSVEALAPAARSTMLAANLFRITALGCIAGGITGETRQRRARAGAERGRAVALRELLETERTQKRFADHELRSLVTVINTALELLDRDPERPQLPGQLDHALAFLEEGARALAEVVSPGRPRDSGFDVITVLEREAAFARGLGLSVSIAVGAGEFVAGGDPGVLARTIRIVLENAKIHAPGCRVSVVVNAVAGQIAISVSDDGPGLQADEIEKVFEPGWRGQGELAPGEGLGLSIARVLLSHLDGAINALPGINGGACFELRIPALMETSNDMAAHIATLGRSTQLATGSAASAAGG